MAGFERILVPIHFSRPSRHALDEAIAFARKLGSELHLLHCYYLIAPTALASYRIEVPISFDRETREAARRQLAQASQRVSAAGVRVSEHLTAGIPAAETTDLASELGADLIVMGTRGLSGLEHWMLGSVAERVVRLAPCPVLTVNFAAQDGAAAAEPAPPDSIRAKEIRRILVPIDFSTHSQRALEAALGLATAFGAELHLLHCYEVNPAVMMPYGVVVPDSFYEDLRVAAVQRMAECCEKLDAGGHKVHEHLSLHYPAEAIAETAEKVGADLIVMGTRGLTGVKHALLGSVAERTIRTARCPVLSVKSAAAPERRDDR